MDWGTVVPSIVASLITSGIILAVLRLVFEKGLEHVLDKRLKEYEASLSERTAARSRFSERRFEGYDNLVAQLRQTGRALRDCIEADPGDLPQVMARYLERTESLQEILYDNALTLQQDGLYRGVHTFKVESRELAKMFVNVMRYRDNNELENADALWQTAKETARRLLAEGDETATEIQGTIDRVLQGQA